MKSDQWIRKGTDEARKLMDLGLYDQAAKVLQYVERHALSGIDLRKVRGYRKSKPKGPMKTSKLGRAIELLKREPSIAYWAARERIGISRSSWQRAKQLAREAA